MITNLEIFLITYNRSNYLHDTLDKILEEKSPIKDNKITILDNCSTDNTQEVIDHFKKENITYIKNNRNIGGNANIAKAFEMASEEYLWILCDDDEYNWNGWNEVVDAIEKNYDAIVVANYCDPKKNIGRLVKQMTFVPSTIYRISNISNEVMSNIEYLISTMFPHLGIACDLINRKKIYIFVMNGS